MRAVVMHWPALFETTGRVVETEWAELFARFEKGGAFQGDNEHPGWSAGRFDPPKRGLENVQQSTAMVLDYDGTATIAGASELWGKYYGLLHTTRKNGIKGERFRIILPLTRPVSAFEYAALWRRLNETSGRKLDAACKDPSRFWYTPGVIEGGTFEACRFVGPPMNPDEILAQPEPAERRPAPVIPIRAGTTDELFEREKRARAYVAKMPESIEDQGGNAALWRAAVAAARGFALDESATHRVLLDFNARCRPPWTDDVIERNACRAVHDSTVPNGYKLGDERQYQAPDFSRDDWNADDYSPPETPAGDGDLERDAIASEQPAPLSKEPATKRHGLKSLLDLFAALVERANSGQVERGFTTGNVELDETIGGYRRKRITIVGAEPSWGKSTMGIMATDENLQKGIGVLLVTGEDADDTYAQRFMARRSGVNALRLRDNDFQEGDIKKLTYQLSRADITPFFLDGIGKPAEDLARAITEICAEKPIGLVIVDYLQAFVCRKHCQDRRNEVSHIAACFKNAIKNANAAGLMFSQFKRPDKSTAVPTMHDLKESGDLENMAEHVLLGHLEVQGDGEQRKETRWLYIGKNKDGLRNVDRVCLPFNNVTANFRTQNGEVYKKRYEDSTYDEFDNTFDN